MRLEGTLTTTEQGKRMADFGYEQTVKYEVARGLLASKRARLAQMLGRERSLNRSDQSELMRIRAEMRVVARAMRALDVGDEAQLDRAIALNSHL